MKRKIIISLSAVLTVFILGILAGIAALNLSGTGMGISTGYALNSNNNSTFLVTGNSPVRLSDYSESGNAVKDYNDGDKILVIHGGIAESYPASTSVYFTMKLSDGTIENIPEAVITSLTDLGWLGTKAPEADLSFSSEPIGYSNEKASISLMLPDGWDYQTTTPAPLTQENYCFSVRIFRSDSPDNSISIEYTDSFGVCGTGLRTEETEIAGHKAHKGIYDDNPNFDYIVFDDAPDFYVIFNNADTLWWAEYKNEVNQILSTLKIAE